MSPLAIEMILHFHTTHSPWPAMTDTHEEIIRMFLRHGLIETGNPDPDFARPEKHPSIITTVKGNKWVEMICETPFPVQTFADPRQLDKLGRLP